MENLLNVTKIILKKFQMFRYQIKGVYFCSLMVCLTHFSEIFKQNKNSACRFLFIFSCFLELFHYGSKKIINPMNR